MLRTASTTVLPLPYPFELGFMQRALLAAIVVGAFAPMIGTFLVQKRMSLIGDGIGHLAFAGVAIGVLTGLWPIWTALVVAVLGALGVERLRARRKASGDLALALFFYSGIALGIVLLSRELNPTNVLTYLFGQLLTVTSDELVLIVALGAVVIALVWRLRRALFAVVTDEEWARVAGLPVDLLNGLLAVLTAVAIVAAMRVVGILLIAGLMVLPVASAQLLARSFRGTLGWAVGIGVFSAGAGLAASRLWNLASGGTIVLVTAAVFASVSLITSRRAPERARVAVGLGVPTPEAGDQRSVLGDSHSD
jgi:zinc transport system permease protein